MSAYTSQDELDQLKEWWKNYGASLVIGVILGVVLLVGFRYWSQAREANREAASALYDQLLTELRNNKPEARATGEKLIGDYASTPYAGMAGLLLARQAYDAGDKPLARRHLDWVLAHAGDAATQHAARLRLARLALDSGDVPGAATLSGVKNTSGFEAEYEELRGDVALAQGQRDAARSAYREALKRLAPASAYISVIKLKLDDLGPEPVSGSGSKPAPEHKP